MSKKVSTRKQPTFSLRSFSYAPFKENSFELIVSLNGDKEPASTKVFEFSSQDLFNKLYREGLLVEDYPGYRVKKSWKFSKPAPRVELFTYSHTPTNRFNFSF